MNPVQTDFMGSFLRLLPLAVVLAAPIAWANDCIDFKNAGSAAVTFDAFDTASKSGRKGLVVKPGYTTTCVCGPSPCTSTPGKGLVTFKDGKLSHST